MPWFRLEDSFDTHPKVIAAGNEAVGLFVRCGTHAARHLTDGFVDKDTALLYGSPALADTLVRVKLWHRARGGWLIHDYLDYNPSREQVIHKRKVRAEAGAKGGVASGKSRLASGNTRSKTEANASGLLQPCMNPVPVPSRSVVEVDSQSNGSNTRASPAVIDAIIKEIHDTTGKLITPEWAERVAAELITPGVTHPAAYVRQAIRNEPNPGLRFLPQYGPPGRHARQET